MAGATRSRAVDGLKLALAVMVVGIHANPFADLGRLANLLTGEGIYRLAVPVFLVFNGWYLQPALAAGKGWATARRAAVLYLLWMALYLPVWARAAAGFTPWEGLIFAVFGYWHLWYLAGLAMAAAALVLLARWPTLPLLTLALVLAAMGAGLAWAIAAGLVTPGPIFHDPLSPTRNPLFLCLPYAAFGVVMRRVDLPNRIGRGPAAGLAALGIALVLAESLALSTLPKGVSHDTMASLILAAPALALVALQAPGRTESRALGDHSSGLYFLHVAFVAMLFRHTDLDRPAVFALAIAGSALLTEALRRSGLARRLF
ncbi:acyltransferase family protein [Pseudogemmobacter blasticus]|uniref:Acyltransferase 3 domain-containing protein n=1 Tax=Fuscovulum blasticum DSM 2131 TaxID=1188250 RepID=A0A2T4J4V7_FUSBL|nr:acyltransferase family protein [Fuscovulum blasticum]PTE12939.1 hypothetical protein C5F44_16065 [Fuscovulum blasticum DSM 2131]